MSDVCVAVHEVVNVPISAVRLLLLFLLRLLRNSVICEESVTHCSSLQQRTNGQFTKCTPTSALSFTAAYMWALSFNGPASSGNACQSPKSGPTPRAVRVHQRACGLSGNRTCDDTGAKKPQGRTRHSPESRGFIIS